MSGTESERTAEDSQDEFESIEVEATELGVKSSKWYRCKHESMVSQL